MSQPLPPLDLADTITRAKSQAPTGSPCTNVCRIDLGHELCTGCFRSRAEIKHFKSMDDADRRVVLDDLLGPVYI
ncbi:hypothetical protein BVER_00021c [Candidatus Burkholderia verschuerenii]|uniref:Fe-S protein n=1 Tax=Candidatus Burkholderia verschuerenii TaxID=242163 RepID=A0A0L0MBI2_9BURK|nr:DUF1289 domain-containing protein [Candidatus Burkholderia verschuerenii]KND59610.1 hypothetical protein BVER_00021c [Candidatus Burkholderia verschuerenii]